MLFAAVILNAKIFGVVILAMLVLLLVLNLMHRRPTRRCPNCDADVRLDQAVCSNCEYRFESFRTSR